MPLLLNGGDVIMVDDSEAERQLGHECYNLSTLENPWREFPGGKELLAYLDTVKKGSSEVPAVLLLDINMPEMNGFDLLAKLRSDVFYTTLPVVMMLTNSCNPDDIGKAKTLGANGFLTKPDTVTDYVAIFDRLEEHLEIPVEAISRQPKA